MKRYIKSFLACLLALPLATSCTDYLDKAPNSDITPTDPFKNYTNFQGFIEEMYNCIPLISAGNYHCCWNFGEEELWQNDERIFANSVDQGNYWAWCDPAVYYGYLGTGTNDINRVDDYKLHGHHFYGYAWYAIRKANVGLANLDKMTQYTQEEKRMIEGQLYFFRGFFHFQLMQFWGGLPYIDDANSDGDLNRERLSYQDCALRVGEDLQKAADLLPVNWDETTVGKVTLGNNNQRINKITALSFLGKNYLFAGSPLMNKESTGSATYNTEFCKKAADALGEALKICLSTKRYELAPWEKYEELFFTYNQNDKMPGLKESILHEWGGGAGRYRWNQINDWPTKLVLNSGLKCYPTANYADYFGMANGMPIKDITKSDAESGYDCEYPWKNRDPRFYYNFIYDGVQVVKDGSRVNNDKQRQYASMFEGGKMRTEYGAAACLTGYTNKKFCHQYLNEWDGYRDGVNMVMSLLRLADVYLMYAEAAAEGYGSVTAKAGGCPLSALDAVNAIRDRANVGHVADAYTGSVDKFMEEVRRERAVELSFEAHRFHDLRRWMLLNKAPYNQKKAIYFDRGQEDSETYKDPVNAKVLNIREEVLVQRNFTDRHYWLPFPNDDVNMSDKFKQNPGW